MTLRLRGKSLRHCMVSNINTSTKGNMSAGGDTSRNWSGGEMPARFSNSGQQPCNDVFNARFMPTLKD